MKTLSTGVAIAAALAVALPAWAQNAPMTPSAPKAKAPATAMPAAAPAQKHRPMRHHAMHHGKMMRGGMSMTQQLNRQELMRIQGGGAPQQPMQPPMPAPAPRR